MGKTRGLFLEGSERAGCRGKPQVVPDFSGFETRYFLKTNKAVARVLNETARALWYISEELKKGSGKDL